MRWSNGDRYDADIKASIEGADEIDARGVDERDMVSGVESTFLEKKTGDLLCSLVQLVAGETLAASSSIVEKSEQVVVGRCLSDYIGGKSVYDIMSLDLPALAIGGSRQ